jgi:tetratricopeptide (TPR) repeat protein
MNIRIFSIYFLSLFFFWACSTSKEAAKTENEVADKKKEVVILTEEKRIEFEFYYIEGLKQKMLGNTDAAIQYLNNCLEINPHSAASLYELATIYVSKGDIVSARLLLEQAIEINPENKWYKLLLARIYQGNNQFVKASEIYKELIKNEPDNVEYYYINAMLLNSAGEHNGAIKAYNELEKQIGYNEQIALSRQNIYRESGKNKEAYKEIERLIENFPDVPEYYGVLADMYKEDGEDDKALEYYHKVLDIDPENGFVHFSLATFYIRNGNFDKGYEHAKIGFLHPDVEIETKIQLYIMLAGAPSEMRIDDEKILSLIELIAQAHPGDSRSYSILADFMMHNNRREEARDYIKKALDADPNSYELWEQLIIMDNQLSDFKQMNLNSNEALSMFPSQPLLYVLNAVAKIQLEEYREAIDILETGELYLADNKKLETQFAMYKAEAYYSLNESEKAFSAFERAIEIEPDNFLVLNNYAYYLAVRNEQLDKAERMSNKVIQANPDNPTYLDTHAWVLFKKGEYRLAKFYMDTAMKNGGNESPVIVEHYGDILFKLNDVDKAITYWQKALEMGSESKTIEEKIKEKKYIEGEE